MQEPVVKALNGLGAILKEVNDLGQSKYAKDLEGIEYIKSLAAKVAYCADRIRIFGEGLEKVEAGQVEEIEDKKIDDEIL